MAGLALAIFLLGMSQKSATNCLETESCNRIEPNKGGEILFESISRQFVNTVSVY
jgi:hypothetical protein